MTQHHTTRKLTATPSADGRRLQPVNGSNEAATPWEHDRGGALALHLDWKTNENYANKEDSR